MKTRTTRALFPTLFARSAVLLLALGGFACASLQYRQTVDKFEAAREVATNPNASEAARTVAKAEFGEVIRGFGDRQIVEMNSVKQADALAMRAYSEWQIGFYDDAKINALRARATPGVVRGSYADLTSRALGALVLASNYIATWNTNNRAVSRKTYPAYESKFVNAMAQVDEASSRIATDTSADTAAFVRYARWRVASDWRWVLRSFIGKRSARPSDRQRKAIQSMREVLGGRNSNTELGELILAARLEIPASSPLRALAEAESKQPRKH
jgi:hypothetical protein